MKLMITGHRLYKLQAYDIEWIKDAIDCSLFELNISWAYSGMASGVDLWFCEKCLKYDIPYEACVPFIEQEATMEEEERNIRQFFLQKAKQTTIVRNGYMVERCNKAIVVWDGNKGGTHNCFQQLLEKNKEIIWIIPQQKKIVRV